MIDNNHPSPSKSPYPLYDLYAVIVQQGTLDSGHYFAYVRQGNLWFLCNDANITHVSPQDVQSAEAYILFYTQKQKQKHQS